MSRTQSRERRNRSHSRGWALQRPTPVQRKRAKVVFFFVRTLCWLVAPIILLLFWLQIVRIQQVLTSTATQFLVRDTSLPSTQRLSPTIDRTASQSSQTSLHIVRRHHPFNDDEKAVDQNRDGQNAGATTSNNKSGDDGYVHAMIRFRNTNAGETKGNRNKNGYDGKLSCDSRWNTSQAAQDEMVYWQNIPGDAHIQSKFRRKDYPQYLTFDWDAGGWNNNRLAFETMVAYAISMGRILVLPPPIPLHSLSTKTKKNPSSTQNCQGPFWGFEDLFHDLQNIPQLQVMTMKTFLETVVMSGELKDVKTGKSTFPPNNRTDWTSCSKDQLQHLMDWLQNMDDKQEPRWGPVTQLRWKYDICHGAFPQSTDQRDVQILQESKQRVEAGWNQAGNEIHVGNGTAEERLREYRGGRSRICVYDGLYQNATFLHVSEKFRTIAPFYSMTFFQDWRYDLWLKRAMRDHLRYNDEIQCAAARVVDYVQQQAILHDPAGKGVFDSMHVRQRSEFHHQMRTNKFTSRDIYDATSKILPEGSTIFVATDAKKLQYFDFLHQHYKLVFLHDCQHLLEEMGVHPNLWALVEQLVASRGRFYFASVGSTFGSYIARLQGYHLVRTGAPGAENGTIATWPLNNPDDFHYMRKYQPLGAPLWYREFPTCWVDLQNGMEQFHRESVLSTNPV
jgi:GDP-fucose protein O-fucosyltransferase